MTPWMKAFVFSLAALALTVASGLPSSFANVYSKGSLYCSNFRDAEERFQREPDNKYKAASYVICLFARGEGNDDALAMDIAENTATRFNDVSTAWRYARFISTGGAFEGQDPNNLNEAIKAFARVWLFITETPHYPMGYTVTEPEEQWTLFTAHRLAFFNYLRFLKGVRGSYNYQKLQSPSFEGDRDALELWPQYAKHTLYSLEQAIDKGRTCANISWKSYFRRKLYDQVTTDCQLMKETAEKVYNMEIRRLQLLETCEDIIECLEYYTLTKTMEAIVSETSEKRKAIYNM